MAKLTDGIDDEVIGIARRKCEDDDETDDPVEAETSKRSIERTI